MLSQASTNLPFHLPAISIASRRRVPSRSHFHQYFGVPQQHFNPEGLQQHPRSTPAPWLFAPWGLGTSAPRLLLAQSTEQPPWSLPAGNRWLCCKDLLQMLMLSFRWRALRMICQNGFHTLLLKLCPLLSRRWRRSAARRAGGMREARLAAARAAEQGQALPGWALLEPTAACTQPLQPLQPPPALPMLPGRCPVGTGCPRALHLPGDPGCLSHIPGGCSCSVWDGVIPDPRGMCVVLWGAFIYPCSHPKL